MPPQSPAAGAVAGPSLLVSPPTLSSLIEVSVTGAVLVPLADSEPLTIRLAPGSALSTVPAAALRVLPAGTVSPPLANTTGGPAYGSVQLAASVPATAMTSC